jgi:hypothetical protein
MVKKLENGRTTPNIASQHQNKKIHHKMEDKSSMDEKIKYARSAYLNARRPHIKSRIGYKTGDKHNSRVNTKGEEFIKFINANIQQEKKQNIKTTNNRSYHDFDSSYALMRNKLQRVIILHVGSHHKGSKTCVWVSKCLVTNLRGLNQTWVPKNQD